jgi:hypothetical protein
VAIGSNGAITHLCPEHDGGSAYYPLGDYLQNDLDTPRSPSVCVASLPSDRASDAPPMQLYSQDPPMAKIYDDSHGCSDSNCSIWSVRPASNFRSLGDVVSQDQDAKPTSTVPVLRSDLLVKGSLEYMWSDQSSSADQNVEVFRVEPPSNGLATGCFEAQSVGDYDHVPHNDTVGYVPLVNPPYLSHFTFWRPDGKGDWNRTYLDAGGRITAAAFTRLPSSAVGVFAVKDNIVRFASSEFAQWTALRGPSGRTFVKLLAGTGQHGLAQVFVLDSQRVLYAAHQNPPGSDAPFTDLLPIATEVTGVSLGDARDRSELYATGNEGRFYRISQDPQTTDWTPAEITLSETDEIEPLQTYTTQFQVFDEMGSPAAARAVPLWASAPATVSVNGRNFLTGPEAPATVRPTARASST